MSMPKTRILNIFTYQSFLFVPFFLIAKANFDLGINAYNFIIEIIIPKNWLLS